MRAGAWRVIMIFHDIIVAEDYFLVAPVFSGRHKRTTLEESSSSSFKKEVSRENLSTSIHFESKTESNLLPQLSSDVYDDKSGNRHETKSMSTSKTVTSSPLIDSLTSSFWSVQEVCLVIEESEESSQQREYSLLHHSDHYQDDDRQENGLNANADAPKNNLPSHHQSVQQHHARDDSELDLNRKKNDWSSCFPEDASPASNSRMKLTPKSCSKTAWSSFSPDPKSEII